MGPCGLATSLALALALGPQLLHNLVARGDAGQRGATRGGTGAGAQIGCGQMESTLMGPLQKIITFDRWGKKALPGTFGKIQVG